MAGPLPPPAFVLPMPGPAQLPAPTAPQASTSRAPVASSNKPAPSKARGSKAKANGLARAGPVDPPSANVVRAGTAREEETLSVNPKQYSRILKRRAARARLEETKRLSNERKVRAPRSWYLSLLERRQRCELTGSP